MSCTNPTMMQLHFIFLGRMHACYSVINLPYINYMCACYSLYSSNLLWCMLMQVGSMEGTHIWKVASDSLWISSGYISGLHQYLLMHVTNPIKFYMMHKLHLCHPSLYDVWCNHDCICVCLYWLGGLRCHLNLWTRSWWS